MGRESTFVSEIGSPSQPSPDFCKEEIKLITSSD